MTDVTPTDLAPTLGLFDPPQVRWQPVSLKLITVRLLGWVVTTGVLLGASVALCLLWRGLWSLIIAAVVAVILVWQGVLIPRRVRAMAYAVKDRDLYERHGVMFRHMSIVPYVRIQYVDVNVGPIERRFGLASLQINTASPTLTTRLAGIPVDVANQIRDVLTDRGKLTGSGDVEGAATGLDTTAPAVAASTEPLHA